MIEMEKLDYEGIAKVLEQINKLYENGADKSTVDSLLGNFSYRGSILLDKDEIEAVAENSLIDSDIVLASLGISKNDIAR